jgi:uncharacterized protein
MGIEEILGRYREEIYRIASKHGVTRVRVFGSLAEGTAGPESDIDLLVEAGKEVTPWFPAGLKGDLEDLLGRHVHIAEEDGLMLPAWRDYVLGEAVDL